MYFHEKTMKENYPIYYCLPKHVNSIANGSCGNIVLTSQCKLLQFSILFFYCQSEFEGLKYFETRIVV